MSYNKLKNIKSLEEKNIQFIFRKLYQFTSMMLYLKYKTQEKNDEIKFKS
tara:strand:- start:288 stop:437 length:150 start_codon:yes stop_codon:yes gene_type:complete